ncbi:glycosyltransferase [Streptomonospora nanhaiensis]|uniref:glycosyltransferase n=1 Tax=Streptomonospora nanhaiensis TaxID=1323731 RepID=UPI001C38E9C7|nr:glycosyltransferase [Streptomonospora nanhaiensis]MBV2362070.1 glycosyltransferase [Streptomonospora nanhaiensis]MBX9391536.1 glycosyltransferase [Streptomonospora nanhaiensis]
MKIAFLIANAYGMGGTIRTVFTLSQGLTAAGHDVEIVSLARHRDQPFFPLPDGVTLRALSPGPGNPPGSPPANPPGGRPDAPPPPPDPGPLDRWRHRRVGGTIPLTEARNHRVFDARRMHALAAYLRGTDADAAIGTRPGLNLLLARWAPPRLLRIGQEHVHHDRHAFDIRFAIARRYRRLDGLTVLTEADRARYHGVLRSPPGWLAVMPNPLPPGRHPRAALDAPVVAAAGRADPVKQYPLLLDAFAEVARCEPDWRLRIYGTAKRDEALRAIIADKGLGDRVALMGRVRDLSAELAGASVLAVSSRSEGFGMTIIEAFAAGVPVVSFDCPHGPREIIDHGRTGLLVTPQDPSALAGALLRLARDPALRRRMGDAARRAAAAYDLGAVTRRWEDYLAARMAAKRHGLSRAT